MNIKCLMSMALGMTLSFSAFADELQPIACRDLQGFASVKQALKNLDQSFEWNNPDCKVVGTKSVFPRKNKRGTVNFAKGMQLFVYQNNQLKFICLPGWQCKAW